MTLAKSVNQSTQNTERSEIDQDIVKLPPCDLWSNEPPLESDWHREQIDLLLAYLKWWWRDRNDYYATGNLTIYYSEDKITTRDFRGPDFFVVLGADNHPRRSWMTWVEGGQYPNVIIELLSNSTAKVDREAKKQLYQDIFRTPEYFWFHLETMEFQGFYLIAGEYQPIELTFDGRMWSQQMELFLGIHNNQLRFFTMDQTLIPTPQERANDEQRQKEVAQEQLNSLKAKLEALGIDPEQ